MNKWVNWSGSVRFNPREIVEPTSEEEIIKWVFFAHENKSCIRPVGSSHSSSRIFETKDILLSLKHFGKLHSYDIDSRSAVTDSAITIENAGKELHSIGLSLHNQGDINKQTIIGGSVASTHGTGGKLKIVADCLSGVRMINGNGECREYTEENDPEIMQAIRVSLGGLGIVTQVRLKLERAFNLHRQEWCARVFDCMEQLDELVASNRNFDFYWYPRSDLVKLRTWNEPGREPPPPKFAILEKEEAGPSYNTLSRERELKFEEMEYAVPFEVGPDCFWEVRKAVKKLRRIVGWRVLYRTIAEDSNFLSLANRRKSATISVHQNNTLPYQEYFGQIEPILRSYGGRPHWGKKHSLYAEDLKPLYLDWDKFLSIRQQMDPNGIFMTPYLKRLLLG